MRARNGRLIGILGFVLLSIAPSMVTAAEKLTFNMAWLPQGSVGGVLVAQGKGYFSEAGLDVEIVRGYGGQRTVNEVDQALFDVGYGDPISVILNRANAGKTVLIGAINTRWPAGLCYLGNAGVNYATPADLAGKTMGGGPGSPVQKLIPAWLQINKVSPDAIQLLKMDPAVYNSSLVDGRIDLSECWEGSSQPLIAKLAEDVGKSIKVMLYRDFGLDIYGNGFVATEKTIAERPDALRKFLKASYRGYAYMAENTDDAAATILAQYSTLNKVVLLGQMKQTTGIVTDAASPDKRMGYMRTDRISNTLRFAQEAYGVGADIKLENIYTNALLQ